MNGLRVDVNEGAGFGRVGVFELGDGWGAFLRMLGFGLTLVGMDGTNLLCCLGRALGCGCCVRHGCW